MLLIAPLILAYLLGVIGTLVFLMIWTIGRARRRGPAQVVKTIGTWALAGLLAVLAAFVGTMAFGRSSVSASTDDLIGYWTSESSGGSSMIDLRSDGSAYVAGVPSVAAWEVGSGADDLRLPPELSGAGTWRVGSNLSVQLTCGGGQTVTLVGEAVQSSMGTIYLQFMAGDPDAPTYFREFSRVDSASVRENGATAGVAC